MFVASRTFEFLTFVLELGRFSDDLNGGYYIRTTYNESGETFVSDPAPYLVQASIFLRGILYRKESLVEHKGWDEIIQSFETDKIRATYPDYYQGMPDLEMI